MSVRILWADSAHESEAIASAIALIMAIKHQDARSNGGSMATRACCRALPSSAAPCVGGFMQNAMRQNVVKDVLVVPHTETVCHSCGRIGWSIERHSDQA